MQEKRLKLRDLNICYGEPQTGINRNRSERQESSWYDGYIGERREGKPYFQLSYFAMPRMYPRLSYIIFYC